jgi:hypothetical protein
MPDYQDDGLFSRKGFGERYSTFYVSAEKLRRANSLNANFRIIF